MDLGAQWITALTQVGAVPDPSVGRSLIARYAEPHRRYHTVDHLCAVLSIVDMLAAHAADASVVRLAAWYHDAVYDPRRDDNEERSARLAESELAAIGLAPDVVAAVARLVRLTVNHDPVAGDADGELLCDADLAVLANPAPAYDCYVVAVRAEYGHVSEPDWCAGRGAVLRGLLARSRLFSTPEAAGWEQPARDNLSRELAGLGASPVGP